MKNLRTYLLAGAMLIACSASAQFVNSGSTSSTSTSSPLRNDLTGWDRITVSYAPLKITTDIKGADDFNLNGLSIGYAKGISIAKRLPFFIETGINLQYATKSLDWEDAEETGFDLNQVSYKLDMKISTFNLKVPVNLAYKLTFSNVSLTPYAGINFKINVLAKTKHSLDDPEDLGPNETEDEFWKDMDENYEITSTTNMFDKEEMENNYSLNKDYLWKRFQMGWQIGVGLDYNHFHVGLGYTKDIMELYRKTKTSSVLVTLGYNF